MTFPDHLLIESLAALPQGVVITDVSSPEQPIVWCNQAFCELTGYSTDEILGRNCRFLQGAATHPETRAILKGAIERRQACLVEILNYRKDGTAFWNALSIAPVAAGSNFFVGIQTDITHFKHIETEQVQQTKLETLGRMTGTVAHDMRNVVTVLLGSAQLLLKDPSLSPRQRELVEMVQQAGDSISGLSNTLTSMIRRRTPVSQPVDLGKLLQCRLPLLQQLVGRTIEFSLDLHAGNFWVRTEGDLFTNMLVNLVSNARDAMPTGGRITLRTSLQKIPDSRFDQLLLEVIDTGEGIPPELLHLVTEPFFTTKADGHGTGLGLASVKHFIKELGGKLTLSSTVGHGTTVAMLLPLTLQEVRG
jgi:two-component system, cell cycle sensor histidine kinase and response regulator CckA